MSKINRLLSNTPAEIVLTTAWLVKQGYSFDLISRYKKSRWLESVGYGAVKRCNDKINYMGGLYALQEQSGLKIHVGGRTALALQDSGQYLDMANSKVNLFGSQQDKLPSWFKHYDWQVNFNYYQTIFLPADLALTNFDEKAFSIKISSRERAIMECFYLAPQHQELFECYELMEGLYNLRPKIVQQLLEQCNSVKVKRLFLYLAEKFYHPWFEFLDLSKVNLGTGKRSIAPKGVYIDKYKIVVPKEFTINAQPEL